MQELASNLCALSDTSKVYNTVTLNKIGRGFASEQRNIKLVEFFEFSVSIDVGPLLQKCLIFKLAAFAAIQSTRTLV